MRKAFLAVSFLIVACSLSSRAQDLRPDAKIPACNNPARITAIQQAKLVLIIDLTRYSLNDQMVVDVAIRNDGKNDIYVYSKNGWEFNGFLFEFRDNAGKVVPRVFQHVPPSPEKNPDDPRLFARLETDQFLGSRARLLLKGFLQKPGKYTLRIAYTSPAMCGFYGPMVQALPAFWHHDPEIFSNTVAFEVTP